MWQILGYIGLKILLGASVGLIMAKPKKKKMRIFDELSLETQTEILVTCVRYAKGEISEFNLPPTTDIKALAVEYDTMYFLNLNDFQPLNIELYPAFVGTRPVKRP